MRTVPPTEQGKHRAITSGAITNGKPVILNSDGTVSVVATSSASTANGTPQVFEEAFVTKYASTFDSNANRVVIAYQDGDNSSHGTAIVGTTDTSDNSISYGTAVVFESADTRELSATFDSNSNKVVIAYQDTGNASYGTAIVGTVDPSDNSISFGTPEVFESAAAFGISATFDSSSNKVVIAYYDNGNSNKGTAVVGTVSGTGISFGSPVIFQNAASDDVSATFDSNSNKVVIVYRDGTSSNYYGTAIVGTVSGTSISFGTKATIVTRITTKHSAVFDSNSNKVVIAYRDTGNSDKGTAIVGTVSGTDITYGSSAIFNAGSTDFVSATFDSSVNKVVIAYQDEGASDVGTHIEGTVSGTGISFGSETVFENAVTGPITSTFDSSAKRAVIAYRDNGNSNYATSVVFRNSGSSSNLTTGNYIGIATGGSYADGQSATIDLVGTVNGDQSSLTEDQQLFVQEDGTLGTTADTTSVVAGTAISATKLLVGTVNSKTVDVIKG